MKKVISIIIVIVVILVIVYKLSILYIYTKVINNFPERFNLIKYKKGIKEEEVIVSKEDDIYEKLFEWVTKHKIGWGYNYISYAQICDSNKYVSENIKIDVSKTYIIISLKVKGNIWVPINRDCDIDLVE